MERTRLRLFKYFLRDQASNWLKCLPAGSISTWEDLATRFLAQFFPPRRTIKLRNNILMFQQHHGEPLSKAWTRFKNLLQKVPHHDFDLWLQVQIFYDHVNLAIRHVIDHLVGGGKLRDKSVEESWALIEDLALNENKSWNDPSDLAKPVKAISFLQDVPSTSNRRLIELENQVQRLMEVHLAPKPSVQVNKIASSCEIYVGPHDTQYCMENPEQAFVNYASSHTDEARGKCFTFKPEQNKLGYTYNPSWKSHPNLRLVSNFMASQDAKLFKFEANFKQQQSEMTNKINTLLKAINDRMTGALPSDMLSVLEVLAHAPMYNAILDKYVESLELGESKPFYTLANLGSCVNLIPLYLFKKLNIGILEEIKNVVGLVDGTKSYPVGIVKNVEVYVGKLKLLEEFYVIDMEKNPMCPLLVGRGFLATTSAVINCKKAKIAVGEGVTRSIFGVNEPSLSHVDTPYWTTLAKRKS
ncbi:MAK10-like protein [Tanacetum coccineum]